jgi:uncharacterized membrane protein
MMPTAGAVAHDRVDAAMHLIFLRQGFGSHRWNEAYECFRADLGRGILLGLEFLVAGDIIGTVAVAPTFESLGVLAVIVLIRTFLSFSLEVEIEGRWPWRRHSRTQGTEERSKVSL